jgi:predicted amidophosphoribosyltransferase
MSIQLYGNWKFGSAYDVHTTQSEYYVDEYGHDRWNNTRSEMGELVYQLKYKNDKSTIDKIINLILNEYTGLELFNYIIPIPPSKTRTLQPVYEIAIELGKRLNIQALTNILSKNIGSSELKGIDDPKERESALKASMHIANHNILFRKNILLIDDLYRSGSTLKVATELLYNSGKVKNVCVLAMTKTRSKR